VETPKRRSFAKIQEEIANFLAARCLRDGRKLTCVHCGGEIRRVRAFMALHDEQFGNSCIGPGRAWRMEIPYCSACEVPPSHYGCIHMSETDLNLPSVIDASRPLGNTGTQGC
jgi:hypothetical protein